MICELACFISPHGFGHATRIIALLQALHNHIPALKARLFTTVPETLFQNSGINLSYHPTVTDVGLVQRDAFVEDRPQTLEKLAALLPFAPSLIDRSAILCRTCRLIICDISPLGIEVGRKAGIPTLLVENFTWDWIYTQLGPNQGFAPYIELLSDSYSRADYRIQTDPVCTPAPCQLHCPPMARRRVLPPEQIKSAVATNGRKLVLISMGGVALDLPFLRDLHHHEDCLFVVAGQSREGLVGDNVRLLSGLSGLQHPDLIEAADLLICKSGYSTIAECHQTATPICCVGRDNFAESKVVERYVTEMMNGVVINKDYFFSGAWLENLEEMMARGREPLPVNGADRAAEFILSIL